MTVSAAHILAVLDQDDMTEQIAAVLQSTSYRVTLAYTYSKAMEILQDTKIDVIVVDIRLQDDESYYRTFWDLLRWVKGDPLRRSIPFICLSLEPIVDPTYLDAVRIAARSLGAARFLTMERFDESLFVDEIECFIQSRNCDGDIEEGPHS